MEMAIPASMRELAPEEISYVAGADIWADLATAAGAGGAIGTMVGVIMSAGGTQQAILTGAAYGGVAGVVAGSSLVIGYAVGTMIYNAWSSWYYG